MYRLIVLTLTTAILAASCRSGAQDSASAQSPTPKAPPPDPCLVDQKTCDEILALNAAIEADKPAYDRVSATTPAAREEFTRWRLSWCVPGVEEYKLADFVRKRGITFQWECIITTSEFPDFGCSATAQGAVDFYIYNSGLTADHQTGRVALSEGTRVTPLRPPDRVMCRGADSTIRRLVWDGPTEATVKVTH